MTNLTNFQAGIRPFFAERDIRGMSKAFKLGSYDDVKSSALPITALVSRGRGNNRTEVLSNNSLPGSRDPFGAPYSSRPITDS